MRTLSRYFVARFIQFFFAAIFVATVSIVVVELMLNLDRMLAFGTGSQAIFGYLWLRLTSEYASYVVPVAAFISAFCCTALAAYGYEFVASKAGGIPPSRIALPLLACGTLLAIGFALFHETAVVAARREWNRQRDGDENISFERGSFWYHRGRRIYNVAQADRETLTLHDVRIFERDERGRLLRSTVAERIAILDSRHWRFEDALVRHFDPDQPQALGRVERLESQVLEIADPRDRALLSADPAALPLTQLREFIGERERRGASARNQRILAHQRLCDFLAVGVLVAAAIPLGLGVERTRNLGRSAAYAVATLVAYYTLRDLASVFAMQGILPPGAPAWSVLGAMTLGTGAAFARAPR